MAKLIVAIVEGFALGGTYALIALGMVLIFRATDTLNLAHGQFMLLAPLLIVRWQNSSDSSFWWAMPLALVVVAAFGAATFWLLLRKVVGLPPFVGIIVTIGLASVADGAMAIIFGNQIFHMEVPGLPTGTFTLFGARLGQTALLIAGTSLAICLVTAGIVRFTRVGMRIRAGGQDPLLASLGGVNVTRVFAWSWAIGALLAGVAGVMYASTTVVSREVVAVAFLAFPAILLGGLDSIDGAIVGGIAIGLVQALTTAYIGGEWVYIITWLLLLGILLVRPSGIFGTKTITRV
jgi:branched-chain amino acid transport system permease protein